MQEQIDADERAAAHALAEAEAMESASKKAGPRAEVPDVPGIKPIPRPRRASIAAGPTEAALFDDSLPRPEPEPEPEPEPPPPRRVPAPRADLEHPTMALDMRTTPNRNGRWVILAAIAVGLLIIAGSILFASLRQQAADVEKERRIQERFQHLEQ